MLDNLLNQLLWMIPITLFVLLIFQLLVWVRLNIAARRPPSSSRKRQAPLMPTNPEIAEGTDDSQDGARFGSSFQSSNAAIMTVLEGIPGVTDIRMPAGEFGIGRFYNADDNILIALEERSISRRHAFFSSNGDEHYLTDLHSAYGTAVVINNNYVTLVPDRPERIYNGDLAVFGQTVKVRFRLPGETRPDQ